MKNLHKYFLILLIGYNCFGSIYHGPEVTSYSKLKTVIINDSVYTDFFPQKLMKHALFVVAIKPEIEKGLIVVVIPISQGMVKRMAYTWQSLMGYSDFITTHFSDLSFKLLQYCPADIEWDVFIGFVNKRGDLNSVRKTGTVLFYSSYLGISNSISGYKLFNSGDYKFIRNFLGLWKETTTVPFDYKKDIITHKWIKKIPKGVID